jgi:hypothetical protein
MEDRQVPGQDPIVGFKISHGRFEQTTLRPDLHLDSKSFPYIGAQVT